jgi:methyltransferase (TIGR00027 family)
VPRHHDRPCLRPLAHRRLLAGFDRLAAPASGDPAADDRLTADVAAGVTVDRSSPMCRYLQARTAFFDRVTVNALSRQVSQVVVVGAGYDGRALRYRARGVRWWEIDRPLTQNDKFTRLTRLAVATDHVTFLGLDLADGGLAKALVGSGFEPNASALYLAEGLIPYLDADTLRTMLGELRSLASPGTRFALSLRRLGADPSERARFDATVAALGEPAVGTVTAENGELLLSECRWRPVKLTERARAAGFIMAAPILGRADSDGPQTVGPIGTVSIKGELITETFEYDGGREVTVYVPPKPPEAVVFAGDGQLISQWGGVLEAANTPSTMVVGAHRLIDETRRLQEYSPGFDPERFAAHEKFFVEDVRTWVRTRFGVALPSDRTAVFGVSASGELALAVGLRHPDVYGAIFCASPGGGYRPPGLMPSSIPRTYLLAGTLEPFFLENAARWADALHNAGADVVMNERPGSHGDAFWQQEFPLMVTWAFGQ